MFDHHLLDMVELGIERFTPMVEFHSVAGGSAAEAKPCLLFEGAEWDHSPDLQARSAPNAQAEFRISCHACNLITPCHQALRSIFIDFFQLRCVDAISSIGLEHVLCFSATPSLILLRHYQIRLLKSSEGHSPYVQLTEIGPVLDLKIRRVHHAPPDLMKSAMKRPVSSASQPKKIKSVERSALHGRQGRLHVPRQDLTQLVTARMKALKRPANAAKEGQGQQKVQKSL